MTISNEPTRGPLLPLLHLDEELAFSNKKKAPRLPKVARTLQHRFLTIDKPERNSKNGSMNICSEDELKMC